MWWLYRIYNLLHAYFHSTQNWWREHLVFYLYLSSPLFVYFLFFWFTISIREIWSFRFSNINDLWFQFKMSVPDQHNVNTENEKCADIALKGHDASIGSIIKCLFGMISIDSFLLLQMGTRKATWNIKYSKMKPNKQSQITKFGRKLQFHKWFSCFWFIFSLVFLEKQTTIDGWNLIVMQVLRMRMKFK